ncbi:protease Do-like 1, chloroplastic [Olea europaea var. sylvestris]|uniref:protease Do-like 1, chloroplastic n=1 Tax=Olea europaea var. sylvestris TaxID=158386 RepID=UPI000C1D6A74|nr:protease Do-like 1, chloroplastic [Olea europaea var. sylvestris]
MASMFFSTTPALLRSDITNSIPKFSLVKSISNAKRSNSIAASAVRNYDNYKSLTFELSKDGSNVLKKLLDSCFVVCTSVALSVCLFVADVDSASAFVVTTPRKLQTDELATVRLFQENTPSVVNVINLASRQDAFTLDVLEVPQGSGSGFIWDVQGHVVTNYHVIRGASDLK